VRAPDGLALSSRNQYLNASERTEAAYLNQTLADIRADIRAGSKDFQVLEREAVAGLAKRGWQVEYVSVRSQANLGLPQGGEKDLVVLAAARLGTTRLIDNLEIGL
jgi:pantoate--beta-alanine ligase